MNKLVLIVFLIAAALSSSVWFLKDSANTTEQAILLNKNQIHIQASDITDIRVDHWHPQASKAEHFHAQIDAQGMWRILSHHDFPADNTQRFAQIIAGVINLTRGPLISGDAERHADLRIIDPREQGALGMHGNRIALRNANGDVLLDLVFGRYDRELECSYVRQADEHEVYSTTAFLYLDAAWQGWIKERLFEHEFADYHKLTFQAFADKPFQTKNTISLNPLSNRWQWNGKELHSNFVKEFSEYLTAIELVTALPLDEARIKQLSSLGLNIDASKKITAPTVHSLETRTGIHYNIYLSNTYKNALGDDRQLAVIEITDGETLCSDSYRIRLHGFAFELEHKYLKMLTQFPTEFLQ